MVGKELTNTEAQEFAVLWAYTFPVSDLHSCVCSELTLVCSAFYDARMISFVLLLVLGSLHCKKCETEIQNLSPSFRFSFPGKLILTKRLVPSSNTEDYHQNYSHEYPCRMQ